MNVAQLILTAKKLQKLPKDDKGNFLGLVISVTDDTLVFQSAPDDDGDVTGIIYEHNLKGVNIVVGNIIIFDNEGVASIYYSGKPLKNKTTRATGADRLTVKDFSYRK